MTFDLIFTCKVIRWDIVVLNSIDFTASEFWSAFNLYNHTFRYLWFQYIGFHQSDNFFHFFSNICFSSYAHLHWWKNQKKWYISYIIWWLMTLPIKNPDDCIFNPLRANFFRGNIKHIFTFYVIPPHWCDTGGWKPSSNKTRTYLFMAAGVLATQGARTSAARILTRLNRDNSVPVKG